MPSGRKPLPSAVRRLTGNAGHRPLNENEPTPAAGRPACPPHVACRPEAKLEWDRIVDELDQMGILTTADRSVIAMYCLAWARMVTAELKLAQYGELVHVSEESKVTMHNPWQSFVNKAFDQCHKMLVELGLTPSARSRIKIDKAEKPKDDLDDF